MTETALAPAPLTLIELAELEALIIDVFPRADVDAIEDFSRLLVAMPRLMAWSKAHGGDRHVYSELIRLARKGLQAEPAKA
jgi:hypothetical protein